MKATIDNYDKLKSPSHEKKILSCLNRMQKAQNELVAMGYTTYVEAEGFINVMNGGSHSGIATHSQQENVVASVCVVRMDMGAW